MGKKYDGVDPRKANETVIDEELARLELPGGGSIAKKIRRIREYVDENSSAEDWLTCETCGGKSCSLLFERCPYCGDDETDLDPASETIETTGETTSDVVVRDGQVVDASALDECTSGILKLTADMAGNYYDIGVRLKRVHDDQLWRLREKAGRAAYKTFREWAKAEIGLAHTQIYKCLSIVEHATKEDFVKFGVSKLGICYNPHLPPHVRDALAEDMRAGASKHTLERKAVEARAALAGTEPDLGDDEQEETDDADAAPESEPKECAPIKTTVALTLTQQTLPLYSRKDADGEPIRARTLTEDPWTELHLDNGVVMRFCLVTEPNGELALSVACQRLNASGI